MGIENFFLFVMTTVVFVITPGMDTLFVLNTSLAKGKRSGFYASFGINSGIIIHTLLGAFGISLLIAQSEIGFVLIKYFGAAYIMYLGIKTFRSKFELQISSELASKKSSGSYWSGFLTNTLNPKVALFFIAFFPQFIQNDQLESPIPFFILGITYAILGMVWLFIIAFFAGNLSSKLQSNPHFARRLSKVSGAIFMVMGLGVMFI